MAFSAWSENDPQGSDAANTINEAATRAAVRIRERLKTVYPDWDTATDRLHLEKIFINSSGLTIRDDTDANTLGSINATGYLSLNVQPRCRVRKATSQSFTNGAWNACVFDTEDFDVGACHDPGNNTRLTVPANGGGVYLLTFFGNAAFATGSTQLQARVRKNGSSDEIVLGTITNAADEALVLPYGFSILITAAAADYYEIEFNPNYTGLTMVPHASFAKLF